jgi:acetyl-CoA carboxylase biotin carboxyl carrier protein
MSSSENDRSRSSGMGAPPNNQDIFDVRKIRRLVELMNEHELSEMDLRQGEQRIRIRRGSEPVVTTVASRPAAASGLAPQPPAGEPSRPAAAPPAKPPADEEHIVLVRSPMVGTFYAAPDPDSPSYVKVGDMVGPETTVCMVEAMKVFNEIQAETAGKIAAVLGKNGEPVEFGQPLFKVDTRQ